jgi:predicted DCC family thiol-disulfide oxidoreductase YuxK
MKISTIGRVWFGIAFFNTENCFFISFKILLKKIAPRSKLIVFYDGYCFLCVKIVNKWMKIDYLSLINFVSFRDEKSVLGETVDLNHFEKNMLSRIETEFNYYSGFDSFLKMTLRTPVLWLTLPIFYVLKILNIGDLLYNRVAKNRKIVPDHICKELVCKIDDN